MSTAARYAIVRIALVFGAVLLAGDLAVATAQTAEPPPISPADTAWMLTATALVLLMTPALAFFYGGLVRSKNALNTMMMSFVSLGIVGVLWALFGYSLAFAPGGAWLGDTSRFFLRGVGLQAQGTIPHALFMAYQGTFAIITAALISGAIVERMRFGAYMLFIALWAAFVYAPIVLGYGAYWSESYFVGPRFLYAAVPVLVYYTARMTSVESPFCSVTGRRARTLPAACARSSKRICGRFPSSLFRCCPAPASRR